MYGGIFHRHNTFTSQTDLASGLCSLRNLTDYITVQSRHLRLTAKYGCCKWNICCCVNIHSFTLKARFRCYIDLQKKIPCRTAIESRISFSFQPDIGSDTIFYIDDLCLYRTGK